jgi:phage-related protein
VASISIGSVHVDVVPSVSEFGREMRRRLLPDASRVGDEIGREMADQINGHLDNIQVRVNTGRSLTQLKRLDEALTRLDGRKVTVELDVQTLGAIAEVRMLGVLLDRLERRHVRVDVDVDRPAAGLSNLTGAAGAAAGGMSQVGAAAGVMKAGMALAAGPQLAAVGSGIIGLIGPLSAAAVGFGGLAAVAVPSLKRITEGAKDLTPVEKELKTGLDGAKKSFTEWQKALQPKVLPIFTKALGVVPTLLKALTPITVGAADAVGGLVDRMKAGLKSPLFRQLAADLARWVRPAITQIGGIVGNLLAAFAGIARAFAPIGFAFLAVLSRMTAAFARFATGLADSAGFKRFAAAMIGVLDNIASGWRMLLPLVAPILGQLLGLLFKVGITLQAAFRPVAAGLLPVLGLLVGAVGRVVVALLPLLTAVGQFIGSLGTALLPVLRPVITAISDVARQVAGQLVVAFQQSVPSLQSMATAIGSLLPELLPLVGVWGRWVGTILSAVPAVVSIAATLVGYLVPVVRVALRIMVGLYTTVANLIIPVFQRMVTAIQWVSTIITPVFHAIWVAVQAVGAAATWLWTQAIGPAFRAIAAAALWLWNSAIKPAFTLIATLAKWLLMIVAVVVLAPLVLAFKVLSAIVMSLWTRVVKPAFSAIGNFIRATWAGVIRPALTAVGNFIRSVLGPVFRWVYNSVIRPVWSGVGTLIRGVWTGVIRPVFDGIKSAVSKVAGAFRTAVSAIGKAWDGLKSAARKPVQYVVDVVFNKGIVKIWNAVAGLVPGVSKLQPIAFARGGIMPGYAPGRDKLLAAVSPGESIFRPEFTRAVGEDFVTGANTAARSGGVSGVMRFLGLAGDPGMGPGFAGHFALGGVVGGFLKAAKNWFAGGLVKTATAAFNPLISTAQRAVGGTAFGDLAVGAARGLVGKILGYFKPLESKLGGNAVVRAARTQLGVPYVWGGTRWNVGLDCSGLTSQAWQRGAHRWIGRTTYAQYPASSPIPGPRPAALGFPHMGHVVLASKPGYIIEAPYTGANVREVPISRHYEWRWPNAAAGLKFDSGGWLPTGTSLVYNGTGAPEPVLTNGQLAGLMDGSSGGGTHYHAHLDGMTKAAYEQHVRSAFTAMQVEQGRRDRTGRRR